MIFFSSTFDYFYYRRDSKRSLAKASNIITIIEPNPKLASHPKRAITTDPTKESKETLKINEKAETLPKSNKQITSDEKRAFEFAFSKNIYTK